jgi:nucleoside 2-deoxyribosyltransferase
VITVAGGVYYEQCMHPMWQELFGSGGRAATAIARLGGAAKLQTYADERATAILLQRAALEGFEAKVQAIKESPHFRYTHGLSKPAIHPSPEAMPPLSVNADKVVRFGYLEGDCVITAESAVYDPQSSKDPLPFYHNGSTAKHLALILNKSEAEALHGTTGLSSPDLAAALAESHQAEIVIIKMGPLGALLHHGSQTHFIPSFVTPRVWKIGSGDVFVASFAFFWLEQQLAPLEAANQASRATAYYCQTMGFGSQAELLRYTPSAAIFKQSMKPAPLVYLAGPFFSLAQMWLVEEARALLIDMGLRVFSPVHDVGFGRADEVVQKDIDAIHACDLMLAIGDGLDAGTVYEIGYARALKKPVVVYVENELEESQKMMTGTDCVMSNDFVTSIYQTFWQTTEL